MKKRRVIAINAETRTITETEVETLADMQKLVGGLIERATIFANGDELYVNEEGLFGRPKHFFAILGGHQPYAGNAYIIGSVTQTGNNRAAVTRLDEAKAWVQFLDRADLQMLRR